MNSSIYKLQSPEWEREVQMHLVIRDEAGKVAELVESGWGVYPEILTLVADFDYKVINAILQAASKHERHDCSSLRDWFEAFFGKGWKSEVVEYRLQKMAARYFTPEECEKAEFWEALKNHEGCEDISEGILLKHFGMEYVLNHCDELRAEAKANPFPESVKKRLERLERFLYMQKQFAYLHKNQCWKILRYKDGYEYLAEQKDYMAIMNCVCLKDDLSDELKKYILSILDGAEKDMNKVDRAYYKAIRGGFLLKI